MQRAIKACLGTVLSCALGAAVQAQTPPQSNLTDPPMPKMSPQVLKGFVPVSDETLRSPKPEDWLLLHDNYQGWGYSLLDQINKNNVKNLQLAWARLMQPGINEAAPIVYSEVMYLGNPADLIQAIDATNVDLLWEYRRPNPTVGQLDSVWDQRKRSIAVYGDRVHFLTWDNYVVALDARTGQLAWQTNRGGNLYATSAPIVVDGVVITGSNRQVAAFGCFVTGHDAKTGEELWRNTLVPRPGEPGDETWTWAGSPFESRWMTGFGGSSPTIPTSILCSTVRRASARPRKPNATCPERPSRAPIRALPCGPKIGEIVWKYQVLLRDNWD